MSPVVQAQTCLEQNNCTADDFKFEYDKHSAKTFENFLNDHQKMISSYPQEFFAFFNSLSQSIEQMQDVVGYVFRRSSRDFRETYRQQKKLIELLTNNSEIYCQIIQKEYEIARQYSIDNADFPDQDILSIQDFVSVTSNNIDFFMNLNEEEKRIVCADFNLIELHQIAIEKEGFADFKDEVNQDIEVPASPQKVKFSRILSEDSFELNSVRYSVKTEIKNCPQDSDFRTQASRLKFEFMNEFIQSDQSLKLDQKLFLNHSSLKSEEDPCHLQFLIERVR